MIGGYRRGNHGIDALLVGVYEGRELHFSAKVSAGFTPLIRRSIFQRLKPLHTSRCRFVDFPRGGSGRCGGGVPAEEMEEMPWVKPKLVAQVRFVEWTPGWSAAASGVSGAAGG